MKGFFLNSKQGLFVTCIMVCVTVLGTSALAEKGLPEAVLVNAPNGISVNLYAKPDVGADVITIVVHGNKLEVLGQSGNFYKVRVPGQDESGYVLIEETEPTTLVEDSGFNLLNIIFAIIVIIVVGGVPAFLFMRAKKTKEVEATSTGIAESIRKAEESFRSGDYSDAINEFNRHIKLQGGEVRNPDVYRRLANCYEKTGQYREAAQCWTKMRDLGGLKGIEDHIFGVELMLALGKEEEAANIYERLLEGEIDEDSAHDIRKKLVAIYRRIKDPRKLLKHVNKLLETDTPDTGILPPTVQFIMAEGQTDLALQSGAKQLITAICEEFLEEKATSVEAERVYVRCLEYDRTDKRLHKILAQKYKGDGDYRKAVSEFTMLTQLDPGGGDNYTQEAAELYVKSGRIADALAEGNPKIIRKIAQIYLMRSEVHPEAVSVYEKVLELQPHAVGVNKILSTVYLTRGDLHKYMDKLKLLHQIDGQNYDYLKDLAQCLIDNDLVDDALREGNRELIGKILKQLVKREAHDKKSVLLFEKLVKREPGNPKLRRALATAYGHRGEHRQELENLLVLNSLQPEDTTVAKRIAEVAVSENLLDPLLKSAGPKIIVIAAHEIIHRQATGTLCEKVLEKALQVFPDNQDIKEYLRTLRPGAAVTPHHPQTPGPTEPDPFKSDPFESDPFTTDPFTTDPFESESFSAHPESVEIAEDDFGTEELGFTLPEPPAAPQPGEAERPTARKKVAEYQKPSDPSQQPVRRKISPVQPVTTFVSGSDRGPRIEYSEEELYRPETGGTAYKSVEVLRTDGWGSWHRAAEVNTGKPVLLRCFKSRLLPGDQMKLFIEELAEISYNMIHENILTPEEQVIGPDRTHGNTYAHYPFTLEQIMYKDRRPPLEIRFRILQDIASGMYFAHNYVGLDGKMRRTYHLQLQPSLVMLSEDFSQCKIANFGQVQSFRNRILAKEPRYKDPGMNPAYMPPEFFRLRATTIIERVADVYSLGALMYYVVTGQQPFEGPSFEDYKFQHTKVSPSPPEMVDPAIPQWIDDLILKALEKQPENRWQNVKEMLDILTAEIR